MRVKFNLGLIPKKKVSVADIKQYLVDEYRNNNEMQKQIYRLQDELKEKVTLQVKYDSALVTLDEYKCRLKTKEERIEELDNQIRTLNRQIKAITDERNSKILDYKKINKMYDNLMENFDKEIAKRQDINLKNFIASKVDKINKLRGHIKKEEIIRILGDKQ